jgi:hypothetical protein
VTETKIRPASGRAGVGITLDSLRFNPKPQAFSIPL